MAQTKNIGFKLARITTDQFAIIEESFQKDKDIGLFSGFRFGAKDDDQLIVVYALFRFEQEHTPFLVIETGCHFTIEPEAWKGFKRNEENKLIIKKDFVTHLMMLTVGTARGVLHAKTEDTSFNQFILPTINVSEILKEDVVI
jgi:hypothetical protein